MNVSHDSALNRGVMVRAGQGDHLFFSREGIDHQALKSWRHDLIVFGEKKNRGGTNSFCVRDTIEFARNLQSDWSGEEPEVPPTIVAQDDLAQRSRIVKNKTANFAIGCDTHCYRA